MESPFHITLIHPTSMKNGSDEKITSKSEDSLFSKLHCSLLESMMECTLLQNQQLLLQAEVISPRHLVAIVRSLQETCSKNSSNTDKIRLSLDRLAQSVQVAHFSGCLYGNTRKFIKTLETITCFYPAFLLQMSLWLRSVLCRTTGFLISSFGDIAD